MEDTVSFVFGRHRVVPHRRALLTDGVDVTVSGRPFDLLLALIERRDRVVLKDELMRLVWPGRVVEEGNLTVHIASLRKLLGDDVISTVSGRGYRFVAPVEEDASDSGVLTASHAPAGTLPSEGRRTNVPLASSPLIGRNSAIAAVTSLVEAHRVVTLVGVGGIGKTRLAVEVGRQISDRCRDGAWVVELGPLASGGLIPSAIASALRLDIAGCADPVAGVAMALESREMVLVLDNCEHVIEPAARIVEALVRASRNLRVLVTSREGLRIEGEALYQVIPLAVPATGVSCPPNLLAYSAVELFVARASAAQQSFPVDEDSLVQVASICRRLDGIPLAIELAAARATALGLRELLDRLDDRFALLTGGRRTALQRHQTLRAALDWSFELLREIDQAVFRRLAIFAGDFSLDAALHVGTDDAIDNNDVVDSITNLVAKSLIALEVEGGAVRYRLLETTRAYALEKLNLSGDRDLTARRHAEHHRNLFERAMSEWQSDNTAEWLAVYARRLDDVHAAIDWASSPGHDAAIGAELTAAAVPLWIELSLIDEGLSRTERAIAALETSRHQTKKHMMVLYAALARLQLYSVKSFKICGDAWAKALSVAKELQDEEYQLHILWGAYAGSMTGGKFPAALDIANKFRQTARTIGKAEVLIGHRMIGTALSRLGDQVTARMHTDMMLEEYDPPIGNSHSVMFGGDQRALARGTLARILWLQGFSDQAMAEVRQSCKLIDQDVSVLCHRLITFACPVALWSGNLAEAKQYSEILQEFTAERVSEMRDHGDCIAGEISLTEGDAETALYLLKRAVTSIRQRGSVQHLTWQLMVMARALSGIGRTAESVAALDEALHRCERFGEGWCRPELIRIKADILVQGAADITPAIGRKLTNALVLARRQGARAWELRIATTLARLRVEEGRNDLAADVLKPVYGEFTEGFSTPDLRGARAVLQQLV